MSHKFSISNSAKKASNSAVQEALVSYTIRMAQCVKAQVFFNLLIQSSSSRVLAKRAETSRSDYFQGKLPFKALIRKHGETRVRKALGDAKDYCLDVAKGRLSTDSSPEACCVCLERRANYYVVNGSSAHKCVCAVCALELSLRPKPKCPKTRGDIWLVMESASVSYGCVCSGGCERLLVVEQRKKGRTSLEYSAVAECHMCSLESFHTQFSRVLTLF